MKAIEELSVEPVNFGVSSCPLTAGVVLELAMKFCEDRVALLELTRSGQTVVLYSWSRVPDPDLSTQVQRLGIIELALRQIEQALHAYNLKVGVLIAFNKKNDHLARLSAHLKSLISSSPPRNSTPAREFAQLVRIDLIVHSS